MIQWSPSLPTLPRQSSHHTLIQRNEQKLPRNASEFDLLVVPRALLYLHVCVPENDISHSAPLHGHNSSWQFSVFRKKVALLEIETHILCLLYRQMVLPTEPLRQLSWLNHSGTCYMYSVCMFDATYVVWNWNNEF